MIYKIINLILLFCIILNIAIISDSAENNTCNVSSISSTKLSLFTALKTPLIKINDIINKDTPLTDRLTQPQKNTNDSRKNSSNDFLLFTPPKSVSSIEQNIEFKNQLIDIKYPLLSAPIFYRNYYPPSEINFVYLILLMYFVLLSISNLPWLSVIYAKINTSQLEV